MKKAASLFLMAASAMGAVDLESYSFEQFLVDFNKSYDPSELSMRKSLFETSLKQARTHNAQGLSYTRGINKFSDMTAAEKSMFKGKRNIEPNEDPLFRDPPADFFDKLKPVSELPASVDWRDKGVVTPAKNQGGCGSCWAFSTTEVIESMVAIQSGKLLTLGPQQLVSCAPDPDDCGGTGGCQGSVQWLGFNYTAHAGGLSLESSYPYKGETGICEQDKIKPVATVDGYVRLQTNNYTQLMNAVATLGPIAISVAADWMDYDQGVYTGPCGWVIDHAVVLVGYGTENGKDYYLVRNSWGAGWGEEGYIKILRHDSDDTKCGTNTDPSSGTECKPYPKTQKVCGLCGILSDSSYPTGAHLVNGN